MAKVDLGELAQSVLAQGEEVLATVRVNWNGMVPPVPSGEGGDGRAAPDPEVLVVFPSAKQMALVLTGGRILAWSLGISGKPKAFLGEVPLTAVEQASAGATAFGHVLRVVMRSGAVVDLEIMRGEDGSGFSAQLEHLTGA